MELRRATIANDTEPDGPRVPTDPGLGVVVKARTDPGLGMGVKPKSDPPASGTSAASSSQGQPRPKADSLSDAVTPVPPVKAHAGSPIVASIERRGPMPTPSQEITPVPPETTEGLLNGLIKAENEAYFHKAKPAAESNGEAAAAFHAGPRTAPQGVPTPPPQPPVVLRKSVEMDIAQMAKKAEEAPTDPFARPPLDPNAAVDTDPSSRSVVPRDLTIPLPPPRSQAGDKWIAFGVALVTVAAIGILLVRWLMPTPAPEPVTVTPPDTTTATVTAAPPIPSPPEAITAAPVAPTPSTVDPESLPIAPPTTTAVPRPRSGMTGRGAPTAKPPNATGTTPTAKPPPDYELLEKKLGP